MVSTSVILVSYYNYLPSILQCELNLKFTIQAIFTMKLPLNFVSHLCAEAIRCAGTNKYN